MSATANSAVYIDPSTGAISTGAVQFRNRIINGDMRIDQRLAGTANAALATAQDVYTADRWAVWRNASGANYTVQRIANAGAPGNDFALQATVTTSATPGTNDIYFMHQKIEGFNVNDFGLGTANAASFTISFHVRSSVAGTYGLIATNGAKNRSYVTTYTIGTANVWEYKVVTIKGDVAGVWAKDNTTGLDIIWSLGAGSGSSTAASTAWVAGIFYNATGAVQFVGNAVGSTFALTNVQVERGTVATPFEVRPFAMELGMCQRYFEKSYELNQVPGASAIDPGILFISASSNGGNFVLGTLRFSMPKRTKIYTMTGYSNGTGATATWTYARGNVPETTTTPTFDIFCEFSCRFYASIGAAWTVGYIQGHWTSNAEL